MKILAIDPGTDKTGWVLYDCEKHEVPEKGITENRELKNKLRELVVEHDDTEVAIEMIASYGMPVGREVFETCLYIGQLQEMFAMEQVDTTLIYRREVKDHICHNPKAKDTNIRTALLDDFPKTGGGKTPQIGTKGQPGPLFGVSSHIWAALGVAITHAKKIGAYTKIDY